MAALEKGEVLRLLGDAPWEVARELNALSEAAELLSSDHPRLIDEYPMQWVGIYQGRVAASAKTIQSLMSKLEASQVPLAKAIIRFIEREERILIL